MTSWTVAVRFGVRSLSQYPRYYSRKVVRRPVRILDENEAADGSERKRANRQFEDSFFSPPVSSSPSPSDGGEEEPVYLEGEGKTSRLPPGFPRYDKKGNDDRELCRLALDTSCRKKRQKSGLIMLEGKRLIQEALNTQLKMKALFFSNVESVTSMQIPSLECTFQKLTYNKLKRWSNVTKAPGLIGFFEMPKTSLQQPEFALPFSIICDNVRDPGNLGSILRVAASAGCRTVFLTKGCVDLWNDKVLRSAMGSHFHLCIKENVQWNEIQDQLEPDTHIMFADNKDMNYADSEELSDDSSFYESTATDMRSHTKPKNLEELPTFAYYQVAYSKMNSIYLVVGGETEGLSSEALALGKPHLNFRVNIPMLNNVESLNVSSALAILTHEIKRQYELFGNRDGLTDTIDVSIPIATT